MAIAFRRNGSRSKRRRVEAIGGGAAISPAGAGFDGSIGLAIATKKPALITSAATIEACVTFSRLPRDSSSTTIRIAHFAMIAPSGTS